LGGSDGFRGLLRESRRINAAEDIIRVRDTEY
jgi:hypothetical protein